MIRFAFMAISALALAACASTPASPIQDRALIKRAESDIRERLRQPSAGKFRSPNAYQLANGERAVCFDVNTTNAMGGWTGFSPMLAIYPTTGRAPLVYEGGPAIAECRGLMSGQSMRL